jgi:hypothetical protein
VDSLGSAGFVPVASGGLVGEVSLESPSDSGEGEVGGSRGEESAKADSDSGSLWVCEI